MPAPRTVGTQTCGSAENHDFWGLLITPAGCWRGPGALKRCGAPTASIPKNLRSTRCCAGSHKPYSIGSMRHDDDAARTSGARTLPLLPLRDIIVFPHMVVPLFVGREKSINALEEAMAGDKELILAAQ